MPYWAVLILTIVAMVAILVVFMWWWTTEHWDWADAELKPPRTVRLSLETAAEFAEVWTVADCQLQILELEQRVTALEKDNRWHRTAAELLMNLEPRLAEVENVMNQIHKLNPPLPLPTDSLPDTETQADPQSLSNTLSPSLSVKVDGR